MNNTSRYISKVRHHLHCSRKTRADILKRFKECIEDYDDSSGLSLNQLYEKYGAPEEVAAGYMEDLSAIEGIKYRRTTLIYRVSAAFLIACLILIAGYFVANQREEGKVVVGEVKVVSTSIT